MRRFENHVRIDHGLGGTSEQDLWVSIRPEDIDLYKENPNIWATTTGRKAR